MTPTKTFKIIIVGGSVTGLTLANMFERFDIDYILLEAYPEIAPQLGASIGMMANGNRILDQLGMYDDLEDIVGHEPHLVATREPDGRALSQNLVTPEQMSRL
jgi:2-polyprenyl-6-methoxyphenol hydroxylase-like FAD-dependent oxidoreductase